jgi:hypothetical protein
MFLHSRRFGVWLVSFLMVLVIYFIYNRLSRSPEISITSAVPEGTLQPPEDYDGNTITGKVGNVGIGTVKNVRYTKVNPQKQVEREFGFESLLHQDGNDWEIEKPFYTIFGKQFKSTLTGDKARITVETSGGQVAPKEGILTGNVTIRIWPTHKGDFGDAVIYLDDVSFAGDRSLFSTDGFVEIDSNEVRMKGEGLEVVFNADDEQLEHLKIVKLKYLRLKRWSRQMSSAGVSSQENKSAGENKTASITGPSTSLRTGKEYKCMLDRNVVIDTAEELLMADVVSISNFRMSGPTGGGSEEQTETEKNVEHRTSNVERSTGETIGDVTITCDGGILVVPMDSTVEPKTEDPSSHRYAEASRWQKAEDTRNGRTMLWGQAVNYNAATGEAIATGPTQVIFDVNNMSREPVKPGKKAQGRAEVTIVSQKQASFEPALNRAAFAGDCRCVLSQKTEDVNMQYLVTAENLEVLLKQKPVENDSDSTLDIERFVAKDGDVRLASTKSIGQHMLAGVEMKCARMDYNTVSRDFLATGPGLIKYDNSQTDEPQKGLGRFSLRRKCIALLRNFDSLEYYGGSSHLAAYAKDGSLLADFFPDSIAGDKVAVTASRVDADILEKPGGRTELGAVTAKGAITYEDKDVEIIGDEFVYDSAEEKIAVRGTPSYPCRFNGAEIDSIEGNVKTGKWKTRIKGPGAIR